MSTPRAAPPLRGTRRRRPCGPDRAPRLALVAGALLAACRPAPPPPACEPDGAHLCPDAARLAADVTYLASPALRGRRAGTAGNELAAAHVAAAFREAGLAPPPGRSDHRVRFDAALWRWEAPPVLELGGAPAALGDDFELLEGAASGDVEGPLAFAGHGVTLPAYDPAAFPACPLPGGWDDFGGLDFTDRVVVIASGLPGGAPLVPGACPAHAGCGGDGQPGCFSAADKAAQAVARGAAAVLFVPRSAAAPQPRPFAAVGAGVPALWVTSRALSAALPSLPAWLAALDGLTPSPVLTGTRARVALHGAAAAARLDNVVGVIPGADPLLRREGVVVGAHFDHLGELPFRETWYPGADDNASGTAVLLELARLVAASPVRPARTLVFAAWNGEELGLLGSRAWIAAPPLPLADTAAAFSIDMVAAGRTGLQLAGTGEPAHALYEVARDRAAALGLVEPVSWWDAPVFTSDHAPFAAAGIPAAWLSTPTPDLHADHHSPGDTADQVDPARLRAVVQLVWAAVLPWAEGTEPPRPPAAARTALAAPAFPSPTPSHEPSP